jgi:hypothetical protein
LNTRNPCFGDWSAFAGNSDCAHLRGGGEPLLARADREHLSIKRENRVRLVVAHESALRGFKTDDITHRAMNCFATNTPFDATPSYTFEILDSDGPIQ